MLEMNSIGEETGQTRATIGQLLQQQQQLLLLLLLQLLLLLLLSTTRLVCLLAPDTLRSDTN